MSRELNPDFFGSTSSLDFNDEGAQSSLQAKPLSTPSRASLDAADIQIISAQIEGLKEHVKNLNQRTQKQDAIINELVSATSLKFERFKQAFHRVEDFVKKNINEVQGKFGQLNSKIVASNYNESKLEQIIERHNQSVQGFEAKLNQLQKVINSQEMQLLNYKAALDEARHHLSRLKK